MIKTSVAKRAEKERLILPLSWAVTLEPMVESSQFE